MKNTVNRYSDAELEEFRLLIDTKLSKARHELGDMETQINEITENTEDDFGTDWMDDSSTASELDMLYNMANRQRKFIQDLDSALVRIKNKTYGICTVTGELIDKKRLLAVPTTTKSMNAKLSETKPAPGAPTPTRTGLEDDLEPEEKPKESAPRTPKVITKVIRKPTPGQGPKPKAAEEDDLEDIWPADIAANIPDEEEEEETDNDEDIDFDNFASDDDSGGGDDY